MIKSNSAPKWLGKGKKTGGGPIELDLDKELKPYLVFITKTVTDKIDGLKTGPEYGNDVHQITWSEDTANGGFFAIIPFVNHEKGFIFRELGTGESGQLEFPEDGIEKSEDSPVNLILPRVKTYTQVENGKYEETYDSAQIDINSGDVTIYSNTDNPAYLVLIY